MSTRRALPPRSKKISSCVRPGVRDVRASDLRPVSALMSEDLPTFERPAKAISGGPIGGRPSERAAAKKNSQGPANSLRPASVQSARGLGFVHVGVLAGPLFFGNSLVRLSQSSTFTPALLMM